MSLRYTATASMEEPALRDVERIRDIDRWKDKIEVRLDNRQVFFLFFGSAVVACMLFVLGVIVGKRIESRGKADAIEVQDPLAVLDRANQPAPAPAPGEQELTFPKTLINGGPKAKPVVSRPATAKPVEKSTLASTAPAAAPAPPKPLAAAPKPAPAVPKVQPPAAPKPPVAAKGKFTLQLSAFPTKEEADAFAKKYPGAFIVPTDIPGKGLWYRVRAGNYGTFQEAAAAKTAFEKQNKVIALVAAR